MRHRDTIKVMKARGWNHKYTNGGHIKFVHNNGAIVICSSSASDRRADLNMMARVKRLEANPNAKG